jgi:hypothetical protein
MKKKTRKNRTSQRDRSAATDATSQKWIPAPMLVLKKPEPIPPALKRKNAMSR